MMYLVTPLVVCGEGSMGSHHSHALLRTFTQRRVATQLVSTLYELGTISSLFRASVLRQKDQATEMISSGIIYTLNRFLH
jgi:hypothetical protein